LYVWNSNLKLMKKITIIAFLSATVWINPSCDVLGDVAGAVLTDNGSGTRSLTNQEVVSGLKEALTIGVRNAVDLTSVTDGFLGNSAIALPFPPSALQMRERAIQWGLEGQVNRIVETLNRAAEDASKEAAPIFVNAIRNMSIQDGFQILNGGNGAATTFLRNATTPELITAFSPKVQTSIERVRLTEHWEPVMTRYNQAMLITGGQRVETDLNAYVTERAIDGVFVMVEREENKIRQDPAARVTDLLSRVFGSVNG
jgi:hypothetical protein